MAFHWALMLNSSTYIPFVYSQRVACLGGQYDLFLALIILFKKALEHNFIGLYSTKTKIAEFLLL